MFNQIGDSSFAHPHPRFRGHGEVGVGEKYKIQGPERSHSLSTLKLAAAVAAHTRPAQDVASQLPIASRGGAHKL